MPRTKNKSKSSRPRAEQIVSGDDNGQDQFENTPKTSSMSRVDGTEESDQQSISRSRQQSVSDISSIEGISEDNREIREGSLQAETELGLSATDRATSDRVTKWVKSNYEYEHEHNVPRSGMYDHYKNQCDSQGIEPVNSATFGKLIRTVFPGIKTRRLGTRGQSKYHYCNIRLRTDRHTASDFTEGPSNLTEGPSNLTEGPSDSLGQEDAGNPEDNGSQLVPVAETPDFESFDEPMSNITLPSMDEASLLDNIPESSQNVRKSSTLPSMDEASLLDNIPESSQNVRKSSTLPSTSTQTAGTRSTIPSKRTYKGKTRHQIFYQLSTSNLSSISTDFSVDLPHFSVPDLQHSQQQEGQDQPASFTKLYEDHCRELLGIVLSGKSLQIDACIVLFYQNMADDHFQMVKKVPEIWDAIWRWDSILYDTIIVQAFPTIDAPLSQKVRRSLLRFSRNVVDELDVYLKGFPQKLYQKKYEVAYIFAAKLQRHLSINEMAQTATAVLKDAGHIRQMKIDWQDMDIRSVTDQGLWICDCKSTFIEQILQSDIPQLLISGAKLDAWMKWIDKLMEMYMSRFSVRQAIDCEHYIIQAKQLVMKWTFYTSLVLRDLSLRNARSLAIFRIICVFFDDFVLYLLEERIAQMNLALVQSGRAIIEANARVNSLQGFTDPTEIFYNHQQDYNPQARGSQPPSTHNEVP
ncbi:RFX DNA-binding domain-containing protein [Phycomyces blakesleeanus]|uniref:RFX DNA-binding domain-containing protein n=1 Tax=Phycomyces blakesleeanus TaxID=4837 RepID=A0ABR3AZI8_PHYBL